MAGTEETENPVLRFQKRLNSVLRFCDVQAGKHFNVSECVSRVSAPSHFLACVCSVGSQSYVRFPPVSSVWSFALSRVVRPSLIGSKCFRPAIESFAQVAESLILGRQLLLDVVTGGAWEPARRGTCV